MEWERVAAVTGAGGPGSGYVVAPRLVLTCAHVAGPAQASVTVFLPGRAGFFTVIGPAGARCPGAQRAGCADDRARGPA